MTGKSTYTEECGEEICRLISCGRSLNSITKTPGNPSLKTVYGWINDFPEFKEKYIRARSEQADTLADEILALSDQELPRLPDGRIDSGRVQQMRLQVDARKWIAAKLKPKTYGEHQSVEHSGSVDLGSLIAESLKPPTKTDA